jgi:hypothetical protein
MYTKNVGYFWRFRKRHKVNEYPLGENSPILVTLLASYKLDRENFIYFKFGACKVLNLNSIKQPPSRWVCEKKIEFVKKIAQKVA